MVSAALPMDGVIVCFTKVPAGVRDKLCDLVEEMGGIVSKDLTVHVTHVIAESLESEKHKVAVAHNMPVMKPGWVTTLHERLDRDGSSVDMLQISRDFMYKPFEGCLISVTGLEAAKRDMLRKIIEEHGGTYSADMSKTCTHLVAETSEKASKKLEFAKRWGIQIVDLSWVTARTEIVVWPPPGVGSARVSRQRMSQDQSPNVSASAQEQPEPPKRLQIPAEVASSSQFEQTVPLIEEPGLHRANLQGLDPEEYCFAGLHFFVEGFLAHETDAIVAEIRSLGGNVMERLRDDVMFIVVPLLPSFECQDRYFRGTVVTEYWLERCSNGKRIVSAKEHWLNQPLSGFSRPPEFDTVLMAMSGFEDLTRNQLKRLCAKINLRLSETFKKNCTHLLLGGREQATADKRQRAAQWGVKCVCEGWLYQCLKRSRLLDEFPFLMKLKNSSKEADPASTGLGIDVSNHDTRGLVKPVSAPSSPVPVSAAKLSKESQRPSLLVTPAAADVKPLSGVKVSIAKDLYNRENDIRDLVISLGGDFLGPYESRCTHFVQEGWGSKTEPKELRLARHKGKNVVGLGWLLACASKGVKVDELEHSVPRNPKRALALVRSSMSSSFSIPKTSPDDRLDGVDSGGAQLSRIVSSDVGAENPSSDLGNQSAATLDPNAADPLTEGHADGMAMVDVYSTAKTLTDVKTKEDAEAALSAENATVDAGAGRPVKIAALEQILSLASSNPPGKLIRRKILRRVEERSASEYSAVRLSDIENVQFDQASGKRKPAKELLENIPSSEFDDMVSYGEDRRHLVFKSHGADATLLDPDGNMITPGDTHPTLADADRGGGPVKSHAANLMAVDVDSDSMSVDGELSRPRDGAHPAALTNNKAIARITEGTIVSGLKRKSSVEPSELAVSSKKPKTANADDGRVEFNGIRRFMTTGIDTNDKANAVSIIKKLGGEISESASFDPRCTHVILGRPSRSEKVLASIASGKWMLYRSYLDACKAAGRFLPEDDFTLLEQKSTKEDERVIARACARLCPRKRGENGPFSGWSVYLVAGEVRYDPFRRILEAGDAVVSPGNVAFEGVEKTQTHIMVDLSSADIDLRKLRERFRSVAVHTTDFIAELLLGG